MATPPSKGEMSNPLAKTTSAPAAVPAAAAIPSSSSSSSASGPSAAILNRLTASPQPQGQPPGRPPPQPQPTSAKAATDPILRNALRYTISAREYAALHRYVLSRSRLLRRAAPSVGSVERIIDGRAGTGRSASGSGKAAGGKSVAAAGGREGASPSGAGAVAGPVGRDDYNARAVRHALRVFVATASLMRAWEFVRRRVLKRKAECVLPLYHLLV